MGTNDMIIQGTFVFLLKPNTIPVIGDEEDPARSQNCLLNVLTTALPSPP